MKIGIIGCGTIANAAHIPAYLKNPDAEIKYFCDIHPRTRAGGGGKIRLRSRRLTDYHRGSRTTPKSSPFRFARRTTCIPVIAMDALRAGQARAVRKAGGADIRRSARNADAFSTKPAKRSTLAWSIALTTASISSSSTSTRANSARFTTFTFPSARIAPFRGSAARFTNQSNRRRRRADRLGRSLSGHRDVLLRRSEARHDCQRRSVLQAGQRYGELRLYRDMWAENTQAQRITALTTWTIP